MPATVLVANVRGLHGVLEVHGTEQAAQLIKDFAAITEEVVGEVGGDLVHIWGDEAFVLFRTPQQAIRAAVEAHQRYGHVRCPGGRSLGVGIGIAAGNVTWVLTGHVGRPVRRAAQLSSLAGPGQTLLDAGIREQIPQMYGVRFIEIPLPQQRDSGASTAVALLRV